MLFKKEDIGKCISKEISDVLRRYVGRDEFVEAAELASEAYSRVSPSTVRDVTYRNNPLTENNSKAMNILAKIAHHKSNNTELQAQYDHQYLEKNGVPPTPVEQDHILETLKPQA